MQNVMERNHLEDTSADERIILKLVLREKRVRVNWNVHTDYIYCIWTGYICKLKHPIILEAVDFK